MSTPVDLQQCDECGRLVASITRVVRTHRYCSTCYAREFKRAICSSCGRLARMDRRLSAPVCARCDAKHTPCIRCRRAGLPLAKITKAGPVCAGCAPYFREERPCSFCGALSKRLARVRQLGFDEPVCERCQRLRCRTCSACRRHRPMDPSSSEGKPLCVRCATQPNIACQRCGSSMPAGRVTYCEDCGRLQAFEHRLRMMASMFSTVAGADRFRALGAWLLDRLGARTGILKLRPLVPPLLLIDQLGQRANQADAIFGVLGVRPLQARTLLAQFLQQQGIDLAAVRKHSIEVERTTRLLRSLPEASAARAIANDYARTMQARPSASAMTVRLAMRPAVELLRVVHRRGGLPIQADLDHILRKTPGQRAALHSFVSFLKKRHDVTLVLPSIQQAAKLGTIRQRRVLERELMAAAQASDSPENRLTFVGLALRYFHRLKSRTVKDVVASDVRPENDGYTIQIDGRSYWVPGLPATLPALDASRQAPE